jgi:hypothetical protein
MFEQARSLWRRLTGAGAAAGGGERRVWVRFPADPGAPAGDTDPIPARVHDLSRGGVSLVLDRGHPAGHLLHVELPGDGEGQPGGTALAYILRATELPGGAWSLGCAFAAELGDDALRALGGRRQRPAAGDRRAWTRFPARGTALYFPVGSYAPTRRAAILDVSPTGVGLAVEERLEPGAVLSVELTCPDAPPLSVLASVVYVSPREAQRWLLGCSFIHELGEDEFQELRGDGAPAAD